MFSQLSDRFHALSAKLSREKKLTEDNIKQATREVRLALLDADVNYSVVSYFIKKVKEKAVGEEATKGVSVKDQFINIVHDELKSLIGDGEHEIKPRDPFTKILMCGLQGSGKTTTTAKLANYLISETSIKKPLLVACDLQRPAAIEQLEILGQQIGVDVFSMKDCKEPTLVAKKATEYAVEIGSDCVIYDTAGRLHIDDELMKELKDVANVVHPHEVFFVANAALGQDAVATAKSFDELLSMTGVILTMLDGTTRAGAALSVKHITGKPIRYEGIGEKIKDFRLFNPESMADRILGMGDVINLVKQAEKHMDEKEAMELEQKLKKAAFTYDDYLKQMRAMKSMGSLKSLMAMVPGMGGMEDFDMPDDELKKVESIILSMTPKERAEEVELLPSRRRRMATGSGTTIDDVNHLIKSFKRLKQMFKGFNKMQKKLKKGAKSGNSLGMGQLFDRFFS